MRFCRIAFCKNRWQQETETQKNKFLIELEEYRLKEVRLKCEMEGTNAALEQSLSREKEIHESWGDLVLQLKERELELNEVGESMVKTKKRMEDLLQEQISWEHSKTELHRLTAALEGAKREAAEKESVLNHQKESLSVELQQAVTREGVLDLKVKELQNEQLLSMEREIDLKIKNESFEAIRKDDDAKIQALSGDLHALSEREQALTRRLSELDSEVIREKREAGEARAGLDRAQQRERELALVLEKLKEEKTELEGVCAKLQGELSLKEKTLQAETARMAAESAIFREICEKNEAELRAMIAGATGTVSLLESEKGHLAAKIETIVQNSKEATAVLEHDLQRVQSDLEEKDLAIAKMETEHALRVQHLQATIDDLSLQLQFARETERQLIAELDDWGGKEKEWELRVEALKSENLNGLEREVDMKLRMESLETETKNLVLRELALKESMQKVYLQTSENNNMGCFCPVAPNFLPLVYS